MLAQSAPLLICHDFQADRDRLDIRDCGQGRPHVSFDPVSKRTAGGGEGDHNCHLTGRAHLNGTDHAELGDRTVDLGVEHCCERRGDSLGSGWHELIVSAQRAGPASRRYGGRMAAALEYRILDVFTDRPFAGNPLAVVFGAEKLPTSSLAALAREFNLSESAFPLPPTTAADYRVRIFTPETELPFAGHPSVGTAWVLADRGALSPGRAVQECGAGLVRVEVAPAGGPVRLFGAAARSKPISSPAPLLDAVGLTEDHLGAQRALLAGAGLDFAYLAVRPGALDDLVPDHLSLTRLHHELSCAGLAVVEPGQPRVRVRVLAGGVGVGEDPATGSAALGLGAALVDWGIAPADGVHDYTVEQGAHIGRPSLMLASVTAERGEVNEVSVAGSVVSIAEGRIRVP